MDAPRSAGAVYREVQRILVEVALRPECRCRLQTAAHEVHHALRCQHPVLAAQRAEVLEALLSELQDVVTGCGVAASPHRI